MTKDADDRMTEQIIQLAEEQGVLIGFANSRLKLGKAYGIYADATAVAITGLQFLCIKHKGFVFTQKMNHLDMWY